MSDKLKVMIITQSLSGGGAEKLAANLSIGLKDKAEVILVTYWSTEQEYSYSGTRVNLDLAGSSIFGKVLTAVKRIVKIHKLKKQYGIDVSISYIPPCDYVNVLSKRKYELTIIDVVSNMSIAFPRGIARKFRNWVLKRADHLVTVSEGVREDLIKNFGIDRKGATTIYNSCDISAIEEAITQKNNQFNIELPDNFIVSMGSFRMPKGHWHLIKAFYTVAQQIPEVALVILGDGIYRKQYEELIKKLGLESRVYLPGFINPPHYIISKSKLFVFSSVYEGFGNAVIEAMACGVPVVSSDCKYGPREILAPTTSIDCVCRSNEICEFGIITPPFEVSDIDISGEISEEEREMGRAIVQMLQNEDLSNEYIKRGNKHCHNFDNEHIASQWLKLIGELKKDVKQY